jgi:hypothetical protein
VELEFSISLSDATPFAGTPKAQGETFQYRFGSVMAGRPPLEEILRWINSQIPEIERQIVAMLANPGTKIIHIHGRFPVRQDAAGRCTHESIDEGVPYSDGAFDLFKHKVISLYERN